MTKFPSLSEIGNIKQNYSVNLEKFMDHYGIEQDRLKAYMTVIGGLCFNMFTGNINLWGNVANYVISYFHYLGDKNATNEMGLSVLPVGLFVCNMFYGVGTYMMKKYNIKLVMVFLSVLMLSSILIASYAQNWWLYMICISFIFPAGIGMVYWIPLICAWEWFPDRKGMISGMIIGGAGFGPFIFSFVSTAIVNPDNVGYIEKDGMLLLP